MLKIAGFGLLGLIAAMVIPSAVPTEAAPMMLYGTASVELADPDGDVVFAQTVHNRVLDGGEDLIIDQVFDTADAAKTGDNRVSSLCLLGTSATRFSGSGDAIVSEATDSLYVDSWLLDTSEVPFLGGACLSANVDDSDPYVAVLEAAFTSGTHVNTNIDVAGVAVCANGGVTSTCGANNGVALAAANLADQNMGASGSTFTITYTFNATTPTT